MRLELKTDLLQVRRSNNPLSHNLVFDVGNSRMYLSMHTRKADKNSSWTLFTQ